MRIPTELRAKAVLRTASIAGAMAVIVHRGDPDAGILFVKVRLLDGRARLLGPAPASLSPASELPRLVAHLAPEGAPENEIDDYLRRQIDFDSDLWIVEIEDREGRDFLGE
jgi:hypothetical protein